MPQKVLKFTGINRKVNEFSSSGECEELINLRPQIGGGYHVVKPKKIAIDTNLYDSVYEHVFGDTHNLIGVKGGVVERIFLNGGSSTITSSFQYKDVDICTVGNILVVYCESEKRQLVYKFEDEAYRKYSVALKPIINVEILYAVGTTYNTATAADDSVGSYQEALINAASGFNNKFPNGLCGVAVVGCSYELMDGSELWSTAFIVADGSLTSGYQEPSFNPDSKLVDASGAKKVSLKLTFADVEAKDVKRINVYSTRPVFPYEFDIAGTLGSYKINKLSIDDMNLGGQVMYYQGSVSVDKESASLPLKFGTELSADTIMDVNAGCIERTGKIIAYNNRFHYFGSEVQHVLQVPTVSRITNKEDEISHWIAYVLINGEWKLIDKKYSFPDNTPNNFIYPMAGVKMLAFVKSNGASGDNFAVPYEEMFYVSLKDSSAYNYSYAFEHTPYIMSASSFKNLVSDQLWGMDVDTKTFLKKESNAINVSAQFNPFVFPVKYSYSFSGEIRDIATSYLPISSTQIGQYPLTVFTTAGIFALEQGDGSTLYSNITPLQPLVINGTATSTPYGTFFVSSNNLYLLSGREIANMSYVLSGDRELNLRKNTAYKRLVCNDGGIFADFTDMLSNEDFEEYISNVSITYDQLNNDVIISSNDPKKKYSYVLNLDSKAYYKASRKYIGKGNGMKYRVETNNNESVIVDLNTEDIYDKRKGTLISQAVLLQSRPLSLEAFYTHIQRLILLIDATLSGDQNISLSVFGSDNLYNWTCLISSQKKSTIMRQIRTNRAAKSYKDYIILISGVVDTNTDISDLIADYTVVTRRLG